MIFNPKQECMSAQELKNWQSYNLCALVERIYEKVPFYKHKFDKAGVKPKNIKNIDDIALLPFTTKDDMREVYPYGLIATDMDNIVEIHTSSGTTGKPVVDAYTLKDIEIWSEGMARTFAMGGTTKHDIVQVAYGYGLFTGGLGGHYGARKIGATIIPISGGNTKRQVAMMLDFGTTVLACTPSYALYIAEVAKEEGVNIKDLKLKAGFFGAEAWSESMRKEIETKLGVKAYDIFGLTEIIGPGVASECECQHGMHINEDHFYPEIIDPKTGKPLPDGEKGELVITTITKEGTPVLRYRTRDITYVLPERCKCGRTTRRIHRLLGRTDDMLTIRGANVFPTQIEEVLFKMEGVEPQYQLVVDRVGQLDYLEVQVEMNEKMFSDEIKNLENREQNIEKQILGVLGIHAKVKLVEPKTIKRSEGKAVRIIDKRKI